MLEDVIKKLKDEMNESKNNSYVQVVGQFLLSHLEQNPKDAEKILSADKTIAKSLDEMRKAAEKKKSGNVAVLSDAEGFAIVLKYFGIDGVTRVPVAAPVVTTTAAIEQAGVDFDVKLDDFL